jgi:hypothetical protein
MVFFLLPCREIREMREEEEAEGGQQHLPSLGDFRLFYGRDLPRRCKKRQPRKKKKKTLYIL